MKAIKVLFMITLLFIAGCQNDKPDPMATSSSAILDNKSTTESAENDISDLIIGVWKLKFAKEGTGGADYPLQNLYGTGIQYGGTLTLNKDNTFIKLMGITDEISENEGTFSSEENVITFKFKDGHTEEAVYLSLSKEIEYHTQDIYETLIYEYFTKTEEAKPFI